MDISGSNTLEGNRGIADSVPPAATRTLPIPAVAGSPHKRDIACLHLCLQYTRFITNALHINIHQSTLIESVCGIFRHSGRSEYGESAQLRQENTVPLPAGGRCRAPLPSWLVEDVQT